MLLDHTPKSTATAYYEGKRLQVTWYAVAYSSPFNGAAALDRQRPADLDTIRIPITATEVTPNELAPIKLSDEELCAIDAECK